MVPIDDVYDDKDNRDKIYLWWLNLYGVDEADKAKLHVNM